MFALHPQHLSKIEDRDLALTVAVATMYHSPSCVPLHNGGAEAESGIKEVDGKGAIARLVQEGKPTSTFESTMMGWFSTVTDVVADVRTVK